MQSMPAYTQHIPGTLPWQGMLLHSTCHKHILPTKILPNHTKPVPAWQLDTRPLALAATLSGSLLISQPLSSSGPLQAGWVRDSETETWCED